MEAASISIRQRSAAMMTISSTNWSPTLTAPIAPWEGGRRGIFGESSGGYGALRGGMLHPDIWSAVACHSGDMLFELCYASDFPTFCTIMQRAGGLESWYHAFLTRVQQTEEDMTALNILAMAACYSPDPELAPFPFR